jgi:hypothetical protein
MDKPELRMGKRGGWTPASLRDRYRWEISHLDGQDRLPYAYGVLAQMAKDGSWGTVQTRAVALGLELGMNEGVR